MAYRVFGELAKWKLGLNTKVSGASGAEGYVIVLPAPASKGAAWDADADFLDPALRKTLSAYLRRLDFKTKAEEFVAFDLNAETRCVIAFLPKKTKPFSVLELARKALEPLKDAGAKQVRVDLRATKESASLAADAFVSAAVALRFEPKNYADPDPDHKPFLPQLELVPPAGQLWSDAVLRRWLSIAAAGSGVRYLSGLAGNDLTPTAYVKLASEMAAAQGLKTEFFSLQRLEKIGAGAFLAVARASADKGAGILKITYQPAKPSVKIAVVGKGITFDTGGVQIKSGEHMYGMNGDMGGSAVALCFVLLAEQLKLPWQVDAYLAIAENAIGPDAFRPNDIVRTMKGKTIEVTDADAEGRMVLSDTLHLASQQTPDLILDFATLTGACVRAIGTNYSGAYTNRAKWYERIREAGVASGERVWPFPNDPDYGRCLKSEIADIKQCRISGGSDHIEAGYFLSQFVPKKVPWVHIDLSAAEAEEGLAHVPAKLTGFGIRFALEFVQGLFGERAP
ncbi:leucyl aminopeptidase family protein [bacterium]|nr:leucyl aminopeptidase family protein [bacterium]